MEQIKLDIVPAGISPVAHASQFDNGRQIRFNLFNQGTPYTLTGAETVTMVVNGEEENITNTSDNYVIWDVAEEDCAEAGVIGCEIRIVLGSMLIGSKNFFLEVEMDPYNGKNIRTITVGPADICTFETTLPEPLQSVIVNVLATGGNGTPDNPNPINGYTETNITRCGVNLFDNDFSHYRKPVNYYIKNVPLEIGKTYTLKATLKDGGTAVSGCFVGLAAHGEQYSEFLPDLIACVKTDGTTGNYTFTTSSVYTSPKLAIYCANEAQFNSIFDNYDIMLVEGADTSYHPYNGTTVTIAFGQTVYGGVLDVTRGKLTVTHGYKDLSDVLFISTPTPTADSSVCYYGAISDMVTDTSTSLMIAENYSGAAGIYINQMTENTMIISNRNLYVALPVGETQPVGDFVYPLATPFDIDLTPEVISAIVGTNNVFADCGQTEVKYLAEG